MLTPVLQAAGYEVTAAGSAQEALAMLGDGRLFDVAITDIEMPDMDGFQFAEAVRSDPRTAELPIIALSSVVSAEAIDRGRRVGFPRLCRQVRPAGTDRSAQGADRRRSGGVTDGP